MIARIAVHGFAMCGSLGGPSFSAMQTVRSLIIALMVVHVGAAALTAGLAGLRDRVSLKLAGAGLLAILVAMSVPMLNALMGRAVGAATGGVVGATFLPAPWICSRRRGAR